MVWVVHQFTNCILIFRYTICVRQESGYCCIEYSICSDTNSWTLDTDTGIDNTADLDTQCNADDHLKIQGISDSCVPGAGNVAYHSKICGTKFTTSTTMATASRNLHICDCIKPFEIGVYTDAIQEANSGTNRGACLEYKQIPCYDNN